MNKTTDPKTASPGLRRFLYATAGITGACILIVEILGAKMLSPYVGTSHFVWTAQIAVTLVSLALGYYFGGWLVDRSPALHRLYYCIAAAAAYLCVGVLIVENVAYAFLGMNLAVGALMASAVLFVVPLTLLAAVGPFLIRVLAVSFQSIGGQVGRLSAISTLGSVLGTVIIGYAVVPFLPNSVTMFLTAGILLGISSLYFAIWHRRGMSALLVLIGLTIIFGSLGVRRETGKRWEKVDELFRANSNFGLLQVIETKGRARRFYLNDFLVQNTYDPETKKSTSLFTYMLRYLAQAYTTNLQNVLCIGLGVGIAPKELAQQGVTLDVVEINSAVIDVAENYFDFPRDRSRIFVGDGRYFINRATNKYDAVLLDAFLGDSSPSHLMTREAFEQMKRALNPNGVLIINSFGDLAYGKDFFVSSLHKTLSAVFPSVRVHGTGNGNVFFAASPSSRLAMHPIDTSDAHPEVALDVRSALGATLNVSGQNGRILTDDFNPVEFHDAANREEHRRRLAFSVRKL